MPGKLLHAALHLKASMENYYTMRILTTSFTSAFTGSGDSQEYNNNIRQETGAFLIAVPVFPLCSNTTLTGQKVALCASAMTFLNSCLSFSLLQNGNFYFTYNGNFLFIEN